MPDSPEAYYQQIGRAGRDGEPAETLLLFGGEDIARSRYFLQNSAAPEAQKRVMRQRLEAMIAMTEMAACRTGALLACFGESFEGACGHCDNCAAPPVTFDGTTDAQKVLSAVYRTGQRFGALHVISVLMGEASAMATQRSHDKLAVFGIGADRTRDYWRGVIRQLIAYGALAVDMGEFSTLALVTEKARPILRGEVAMLMRQERAAARPARARDDRLGPATTPEPAAGAQGSENSAFYLLRAWRAGEARAQGVPPYVIFHDATLREIAAVRPASIDELGEIKGVGASKLSRYGAKVLHVLLGVVGS